MFWFSHSASWKWEKSGCPKNLAWTCTPLRHGFVCLLLLFFFWFFCLLLLLFLFLGGVPTSDRNDDCCQILCLLPVETFSSYRCAGVNLFRYDIPGKKFYAIVAIHSPSTIGGGGGGRVMSACSLTADLLSKCTRSVPFTNIWVQEIVDIAIANGPECNMPWSK